MADDAEDDKSGGDKGQDTAARDDVSVTLMSNVLEKLRALNYEREYIRKKGIAPFTETQFAVQTFSNPNAQFTSFIDLVQFLMKQANHEFVLDKYDDPNSKINKFILALKVLGFPLDFPASKLRLSYGEAVCAALDFVCDKALAARNFGWTRPIYPKEDFADEAEVDDGAEVDADDEPAIEEDEELYSEIAARTKHEEENELEQSFQQMIVSEVDPLLWKTELERVGPKLKLRVKDDDGKEWHTHIERTRKHETIIKDLLPDATNQLKTIGDQLNQSITRMGEREKTINSQFEHVRQEYQTLKDKLQAVTERCKDGLDKVNVMTNEHAQVTEQLRETKTVMDDRGSKMTDTSPLVQIKDALKTLSAEIKNFDLRIGVVSYTLMQAKSRQASTAFRRKAGESQYQDPEYDNSDDDSN